MQWAIWASVTSLPARKHRWMPPKEDSLDLAPDDLGGEEEEEDEPMMEDEEVELSEEDIVSEVARRVAARLQERELQGEACRRAC